MSARENVVFIGAIATRCIEIVARRGKSEALLAHLSGLPGDALMLAPDRWLLVTPAEMDEADFVTIADRLAGIAFVVDQSSGYTCLRLAGPRARETLAKGCRLDLHPTVFRLDASARTIIAQVPVILHLKDSAPVFHLLAPITLAHHLVDHLIASATEFGCETSLIAKDHIG